MANKRGLRATQRDLRAIGGPEGVKGPKGSKDQPESSLQPCLCLNNIFDAIIEKCFIVSGQKYLLEPFFCLKKILVGINRLKKN